MSSLRKNNSIVATEEVEKVLEEMKSLPEQKYEAKHPALAYMKQVATETEPDHLDNYVEVRPFEDA
tara:strand:+ start:542 stop:739 length:198 start_codon:yes stop_codon:yes gene_type:complete